MNVREAIKKTNGRFASVTFIRSTTTKNGAAGELSTRVFRTGVRKHVKGAGLPFNPEDKGLVSLWCKDGYRMIKESNVVRIKCGDIECSYLGGN